MYTSSRAVAEYLLFHYGSAKELFPYDTCVPTEALNFPSKCAEICGSLSLSSSSPKRVLDIGCAVGNYLNHLYIEISVLNVIHFYLIIGGSSFHLTKYFDEVVGIDYSANFIEAANIMKNTYEMKYDVYTEGTDKMDLIAKLPEFVRSSPEKYTQKLQFHEGDACNLVSSLSKIESHIRPFDVILGSNLLCRLPNPRAFLSSIASRGIVIIVLSVYKSDILLCMYICINIYLYI